MRILLVNDDGIQAPGLRALARALAPRARLIVCAPAHQRSADSSSITLFRPLVVHRRTERGTPWISIDGTPADCVKLALMELLEKPPDLVISGINNGLNTGSNILYSGTVAAALEASLCGVPAMAISTEAVPDPDYAVGASHVWRLVKWMRRHARDPRVVVNVNFPGLPRPQIRGILVTRQEAAAYPDAYERREDPRGRTYYWLCGAYEARFKKIFGRNGKPKDPTDAAAVANGYISVTPLQRDMTAGDALAALRGAPQP